MLACVSIPVCVSSAQQHFMFVQPHSKTLCVFVSVCFVFLGVCVLCRVY